MITLELLPDKVVSQISTYVLAEELFKRMKRQKYISIELIDLMENYTYSIQESYSFTEN